MIFKEEIIKRFTGIIPYNLKFFREENYLKYLNKQERLFLFNHPSINFTTYLEIIQIYYPTFSALSDFSKLIFAVNSENYSVIYSLFPKILKLFRNDIYNLYYMWKKIDLNQFLKLLIDLLTSNLHKDIIKLVENYIEKNPFQFKDIILDLLIKFKYKEVKHLLKFKSITKITEKDLELLNKEKSHKLYQIFLEHSRKSLEELNLIEVNRILSILKKN